jgi:rhamnose utilization protein RhaD (predicted bifunctional aldolase and dehydrogenase)
LPPTLDEPELLRYRSNLLGSDLRITNFAGGNTSSKVTEIDPLTGEPVEKSSGSRAPAATWAASSAPASPRSTRQAARSSAATRASTPKTTWSPCTRLVHLPQQPVAASIDTPLHGFLPFPHVDHLHPDWGIALAASANGLAKMEEFNREFNHSLVWIPWQRPGFELGLMMRRAVANNPGCDGIVLGGHGLFTWGETQRECYLNTITVIDQIGQFIERHGIAKGPSVSAAKPSRAPRTAELPLERSRPTCAAASARKKRWIAASPTPPTCSSSSTRPTQRSGLPRHQLPRPLHPHQDPPALCALAAAMPTRRAEAADRHLARRISRSSTATTTTPSPRPIRPPCATPAPPSCSFPASACSASARTRPKPASPASSTPTPFT